MIAKPKVTLKIVGIENTRRKMSVMPKPRPSFELFVKNRKRSPTRYFAWRLEVVSQEYLHCAGTCQVLV